MEKVMKAHIQIKLFATLNKFNPGYSDNYPIKPGITVETLLDELDIPKTEAKLIFINGIKCGLTSVLQGGERVGIFPPVGGG